jgi:signal recognition particle subunit SRP54
VILLVGLQGSGKTTTAGKLGVWLRKKGRRPLLVSTDVYRPAAIEQLSVVARAINMPVIGEAEAATALDRARRALTHARNVGYDVVIADTAGRLHIDDALMTELDQLKDLLKPTEILLVADAMTGQDAVNSAGEFDKRLSLTGVILTKFDGDARGGAALSIKSVTGRPIKFVGVGEKYDALEQFQPERVVGRILGMGDVLGLIEKAEEAVEQAEAARVLEKLRKDQFTLEDFRDQLRQLRRLGPLDQLVGMLPQIGPLKGLDKVRVDEKQLAHIEAIINSMTAKERENYRIIDGARRKRIALGSGRPVWEINRLIKQYQEVRKMMQQMGRGLLGKRFAKLNFLK